jgi:hypothetical protein
MIAVPNDLNTGTLAVKEIVIESCPSDRKWIHAEIPAERAWVWGNPICYNNVISNCRVV